MKFFVKRDGTGCAAFNRVPKDPMLIEVPYPPNDARQPWDFSKGGYGPIPEKPQEEKDTEMLEKGVVLLAELTIELIDGLIAAGAIDPAKFGIVAKRNYYNIKDAVDRRKQG